MADIAVLEMASVNGTGGGGGRKKKPAAKAAGSTEWTTFRIHAQDGADLSDLADARGVTIAALYHELFSETVRGLLREALQTRLSGLGKPKA